MLTSNVNFLCQLHQGTSSHNMARSSLRAYFRTEYQPGERMLVQKIDFFILTFCCLSYFMNYVSLSSPHPGPPVPAGK